MGDLTIEELARRTGTTVRNVRSHQTRGLLPGPEVRGRVGFYGEEHVERLRLIQELQADGLTLGLVERLLSNRAQAAERLLALRRTVAMAGPAPETELTTVDALRERFGDMDREAIEMALALRAVEARPDGAVAVLRPALLATAERVMGQGVSLKAALRVAAVVQRSTEEAARAFVEMVTTELFTPYEAADRPQDEWPQILDTIDALRPLASEVFLDMIPSAIAGEIERAFGQQLREQAEA